MSLRARLIQVAPVLPSRDIRRSLDFYLQNLGFAQAFVDATNDPVDPRYVGITRDGAELHLQWHSETEWETMTPSLIRLIADDVDLLFEEFADKNVFNPRTSLRNTDWLTREFGFYDPDGNGLIFFRDLTKDETPDAH